MTDRLDRTEEEVIAHYESMSSEEIDRELREQGIDPQPTIDAVTQLVRKRLEEWRKSSS